MRVLDAYGREKWPNRRFDSLALDLAAASFSNRARQSSKTWDWIDTDDYQTDVSGVGAAVTTLRGFSGLREVQVAAGTDTTGRAGVGSEGLEIIGPEGDAKLVLSWAVYLNNLSNATNTYVVRIGFLDSLSAEPIDGAYLRYTHTENSGKWVAVTRSNSVETTADTGLVADNNKWHRFEISIDATSAKADFFLATSVLNPPLVARVSGAPATSGRTYGIGASAIKSAGASDRSFLAKEAILTAFDSRVNL